MFEHNSLKHNSYFQCKHTQNTGCTFLILMWHWMSRRKRHYWSDSGNTNYFGDNGPNKYTPHHCSWQKVVNSSSWLCIFHLLCCKDEQGISCCSTTRDTFLPHTDTLQIHIRTPDLWKATHSFKWQSKLRAEKQMDESCTSVEMLNRC